jgi:VanZ family protein
MALRVGVLLAWMALLTYWSNQPQLPIDQPTVAFTLHNMQHRVAHLFAYGLMGILAYAAVPENWPGRRAFIVAIALTSAFGASDELHQSFIPGRRAAIDDWLLDTAAALLVLWLFLRLRRTRLQPAIQAASPLAIAAAFVVGLGLALRPALSAALAVLRFGG